MMDDLRKRVAASMRKAHAILDTYIHGGEVSRDDIGRLLDCTIFQNNYIAKLEAAVAVIIALRETPYGEEDWDLLDDTLQQAGWGDDET